MCWTGLDYCNNLLPVRTVCKSHLILEGTQESDLSHDWKKRLHNAYTTLRYVMITFCKCFNRRARNWPQVGINRLNLFDNVDANYPQNLHNFFRLKAYTPSSNFQNNGQKCTLIVITFIKNMTPGRGRNIGSSRTYGLVQQAPARVLRTNALVEMNSSMSSLGLLLPKYRHNS